MSLRNHSCGIASSTFVKSPCRGQVFSLDIGSFTWSVMLEDDIFARYYHATLYMQKNNALFVFGGECHTQNGARKTLCINSAVMLDLSTFQYTLLENGDSPIYGCSLSYSTFENNSILISGGYVKKDSKPILCEKPTTSAMVMVIKDGLIHVNDTLKIPEFAVSVGHTLVSFSSGTYVMLGGTASQISILTDKEMDTDICPAAVCIIEKTDVSPIHWIQCNLCEAWYHLLCIGLEKVPKGDYICNKCRKACKQKGPSARTSV